MVSASIVAADVWDRLGHSSDLLDRIETHGPDPILPSVFRVTEFAAACVMVATASAASLAQTAGWHGRPPTIDTRAAAAAFRSERYLRREGATQDLWDDISGYYLCSDDRWVQLHCNFPHHRGGVVDLLGCRDERTSVEATIRGEWEGQTLEDLLAARGLCGTMLRTRDQWLAHPQGTAVAAHPLIEIERIGDAPARRATDPAGAARPLSGIRVLDLTRIIAGPVCGRVLAQHGAEVLRIGAKHLPTVEPCVVDTGFGKRSAHLDLRTEDDAATMRRLLVDADVWVQGYRPGGLDELGFGRDDVAELAPGIVHVSLSAYGHTGPWAPRRGFDSLVQTASGIGAAGASAAGLEGTLPLPCQALDHGTGWLLAAATMLALERQRTEGGTWMVRGSLAQTGHYLASLGRVGHLDTADQTPADAEDLMIDVDSDFGRLTHVGAQGRLDGVPGYDSAPVHVGAHSPRWRST